MWVARDKNGKLWLHLSESKPYRDGDDMWLNDEGRYHQLDSSTFPNVKWDDEEPTEVELQLRIKIEDWQ